MINILRSLPRRAYCALVVHPARRRRRRNDWMITFPNILTAARLSAMCHYPARAYSMSAELADEAIVRHKRHARHWRACQVCGGDVPNGQ